MSENIPNTDPEKDKSQISSSEINDPNKLEEVFEKEVSTSEVSFDNSASNMPSDGATVSDQSVYVVSEQQVPPGSSQAAGSTTGTQAQVTQAIPVSQQQYYASHPNQPTQAYQPVQPTQPPTQHYHNPQHSPQSDTYSANNQQPFNHTSAYQSATPASAKASGGGKMFLLGFLGAALACLLGLGGYALYNNTMGNNIGGGSGSSTILGSQGSTVDASDTDLTLAEAVAEKSLPSVVSINVFSQANNYGYGFGSGGSNSELVQSSLGSGVVLSEDGYIVTNYHVIETADTLRVTIEGEEYEAEVVGYDASSDLAVIKANGASGLTPIEIGSSSDLIIGEWVMSLGSPFGLEQSVATGIVSATSRSSIMQTESGDSTIYVDMIQTDAAINPGNSGGALVDKDGKLIGINTLISSTSGQYSGVGFAIPVDYAINIAQQIIDGKEPTHAQLGVSLSNITASDAERYGLSVSQGAYVSSVYPGSSAAEAGLEPGDIITSFDGAPVSSSSDLMVDVRMKNPGDTVTIEVNRNGESLSFEVTLGSDENTTQQGSFRGLGSLFGGSYSPEEREAA